MEKVFKVEALVPIGKFKIFEDDVKFYNFLEKLHFLGIRGLKIRRKMLALFTRRQNKI